MSDETQDLILDFETRSKLNLEEVGLDNYSRSATPLMLGWAINKRKSRIWLPATEKIPGELEDNILDERIRKIAWYAEFERSILDRCLGYKVPINQWRDPMILARHLSMPGKLESVCQIVKLGKDDSKIADGKRLIHLFCEPNGHEGEETLFGVDNGFNDAQSHPRDWQMFVDYCLRDVDVEQRLWYDFLPLSFPEELWEDWFFSQEMNETGMPVNRGRAEKLLRLAVRYKEASKLKLNEMTGLENAGSPKQLLPWLETRGYPWGSINKEYVDNELKNPTTKLTNEAREVLTLRRKSSQSSYTKLEQLLSLVGPDGFLRHQFMFMGAARTGRWSAGGMQVMNMPRPEKSVKKAAPEHVFDLIDREAYDEICAEFGGSTLPFVASCIRMCFEVPEETT